MDENEAKATARKRRAPGEGGIYRRKSDGLWVGSVEAGYTGIHRDRKHVYGKTRQVVVKRLREAQKTIEAGFTVTDERVTVATYLDWWANTILPGTVKDTTADGYKWVLDHYVIPHIGRVRLTKLRAEHVEQMLKSLEDAGLSARTRRQARTVLGRAIRYAEKRGRVPKNWVALVDAPAIGDSATDDALTITEAEALIHAATGDPIEALVRVALTLGIRRGEALGLRWSDIDFEHERISIQRTLKRRTGHGLVVDTPKTQRAVRTLPLPTVCVDALLEHRDRQDALREVAGRYWQESGYVFTTPIGTPVDPRNLTREYHRLTTKAGLGPRRFHALRHSAATLMLAQKVPLEVISNVLGHAGYAITADIYAKVGPVLQQEAISAMDRAIQGMILKPSATSLATPETLDGQPAPGATA
jgi:integrase